MTDLSPAAQAVFDTVVDETRPISEQREMAVDIAAALRAAADQVRYKDRLGWSGYGYYTEFKHQILAIAAELEGANNA